MHRIEGMFFEIEPRLGAQKELGDQTSQLGNLRDPSGHSADLSLKRLTGPLSLVLKTQTLGRAAADEDRREFSR